MQEKIPVDVAALENGHCAIPYREFCDAGNSRVPVRAFAPYILLSFPKIPLRTLRSKTSDARIDQSTSARSHRVVADLASPCPQASRQHEQLGTRKRNIDP